MRLFCACLIGLIATPAFANAPDYYYARGKRMPLQKATRFAAFEQQESLPPSALQGLPLAKDKGFTTRMGDHNLALVRLEALSPSIDLPTALGHQKLVPTFAVLDRDGAETSAIIATDEVLLKPKPGVSMLELQTLAATAGLTIKEQLLERTWLASAADQAAAMRGANALFETGRFQYAQPNFLYEHSRRFVPNDVNYGAQWHFKNLKAESAWDITKGSSTITIAIIDSGVDDKHPDLMAKLVKPYDAAQNKQGTAFPIDGEPHGTACAGDAAAITNNTTGVAGVCHDCKIMPIRLLTASGFTPAGSDIRAFNWAWQNGADIISNSWGMTQPVAVDEALEDAINEAATKGRGGRGAVVLFASGNDYRQNYKEEMASLPSAISIGASDSQDRRFSYSNYGNYITVLAPSASVTTDISGSAGYSQGNYTSTFGGTSSACPVAAGVVGLMLSVNASLTSQQVKYIVTQAVDKVQPSTAQYNASGFSYEYAFGRLNALKAVQMAQSTTGCTPSPENCSNGTDDDCDGQVDANDLDCAADCTNDQDCSGGTICDSSEKKCVVKPASTVKVGAACANVTTCGGDDAICASPAQGFPAGYCTTRCSDTCPGASQCHAYGVLGNSYCFADCKATKDCRDSYICSAMGDAKATTGGCVPACASDADCDKAGKEGATCDVARGYCSGDSAPVEVIAPTPEEEEEEEKQKPKPVVDQEEEEEAEDAATTTDPTKPTTAAAPAGDNPVAQGCGGCANGGDVSPLFTALIVGYIARRRRLASLR